MIFKIIRFSLLNIAICYSFLSCKKSPQEVTSTSKKNPLTQTSDKLSTKDSPNSIYRVITQEKLAFKELSERSQYKKFQRLLEQENVLETYNIDSSLSRFLEFIIDHYDFAVLINLDSGIQYCQAWRHKETQTWISAKHCLKNVNTASFLIPFSISIQGSQILFQRNELVVSTQEDFMNLLSEIYVKTYKIINDKDILFFSTQSINEIENNFTELKTDSLDKIKNLQVADTKIPSFNGLNISIERSHKKWRLVILPTFLAKNQKDYLIARTFHGMSGALIFSLDKKLFLHGVHSSSIPLNEYLPSEVLLLENKFPLQSIKDFIDRNFSKATQEVVNFLAK